MNRRHLSLIKEFASICQAAGIEYWLRGGWAMDFFLGRITREHEDIDLFAWGTDAATLASELRRAGYEEVPGPPPEAQRNFVKDGEELQVALLDRTEQGEIVVAGGPWKGAAWPQSMLDGSVGRIDDLVCPIVSPRIQIEIKEKFPEWAPHLPARDKHREDVARLRDPLTATEDE